jgi:hypothetical protein
MMQPQGLEALMQQSQPAPQMGGPRLAAATDLVASDAEKQILDPRTLAMLKYKDALQAMQAADQMMASAQPAPTAPTVAERTKLAAEQGIAGLAQRLSPGVQQRGSQMAAQQAQQMMSGGLPQLSAPNMAGMAGGGIVAFQAGGQPKAAEEEIPPTSENFKGLTRYLIEKGILSPEAVASMGALGDMAVTSPSDAFRSVGSLARLGTEAVMAPFKGVVRAGEYGPNLEEIANVVAAGYRGEGSEELPGMFERRVAKEAPDAPAATPERAPLAEQPNMFGVGIDSRRDPNFRMKGVDQQPTAARAAAPTAAPTVAPTNTAQDQLRARVEGTGGSTDAGSRYRELTGIEDAIRERRVEQDRLRALQEARFSPEQERSRLLRAGLAGLASRGFGGFSSGIAGEEEIIAGERDTAQQRVVADMDKTISELRALNIGQFEAEQAAAVIHSNDLRALAALDQDAAKLKQDMDIENLRADLVREGYDAEANQALAAAINDAAVRNNMTTQQVLTIAQRIVADDLTNTKTLPIAVQEVRNAAGGAASPVDAETQSYLDQYATQ